MSIAMPGPPPMEVAYASGPGPMHSAVQPAGALGGGCACCEGACDTGAYCDGMGMGHAQIWAVVLVMELALSAEPIHVCS